VATSTDVGVAYAFFHAASYVVRICGSTMKLKTPPVAVSNVAR